MTRTCTGLGRGFGGVYQSTSASGTTEVLPNADTTYDAEASNGVGDTVTASASGAP